jgi:hypothetical protein
MNHRVSRSDRLGGGSSGSLGGGGTPGGWGTTILPCGSEYPSDERAELGKTASRNPATGAVLHPVPPRTARPRSDAQPVLMAN